MTQGLWTYSTDQRQWEFDEMLRNKNGEIMPLRLAFLKWVVFKTIILHECVYVNSVLHNKSPFTALNFYRLTIYWSTESRNSLSWLIICICNDTPIKRDTQVPSSHMSFFLFVCILFVLRKCYLNVYYKYHKTNHYNSNFLRHRESDVPEFTCSAQFHQPYPVTIMIEWVVWSSRSSNSVEKHIVRRPNTRFFEQYMES